tara:strand:- start:65 stop:871 length:807 start_codon:yes stop_codon:yes gene_type:complete
MAETFTLENQTEATTIENLSAEEQDSLEVGEKMVQEQEQLLAGKYRNAEDLEAAYVALQKKLGESKAEEPVTEETSDLTSIKNQKEDTEQKSKEDPVAASQILEKLWKDISEGKKHSKETLNELKKTNPSDILKEHFKYRQQTESKPKLTQQQITDLKDLAGGEQGYNDMLKWAQGNLNKQEIDMFDKVIESGDPLSAFFAIRSLSYRYNDETGTEGKLVSGRKPKQNTNVFRSQAELVRAMDDPRYDTDPAYRQDIIAKLDRSDLKF